MRSALTIGVVLLGLAQDARGQAKEPVWTLSVHGGVSSFTLIDLRDLFSDGVEVYASWGPEMKEQMAFPMNGLFGAELIRTMGVIRYGVGMIGTNSLAYSGFKDGAGAIELSCRVQVTAIYVVAGVNAYDFEEGGGMYVVVKAGRADTRIRSLESVQFLDIPSRNFHLTTDEEETTLCGAFAVGGSYRVFEGILFGGEMGYRHVQKVPTRAWHTSPSRLADLGGVFGAITVGFEL